MRRRRAQFAQKIGELARKVVAGRRDFTPEEQREWSEVNAEWDRLTAEIGAAEDAEADVVGGESYAAGQVAQEITFSVPVGARELLGVTTVPPPVDSAGGTAGAIDASVVGLTYDAPTWHAIPQIGDPYPLTPADVVTDHNHLVPVLQAGGAIDADTLLDALWPKFLARLREMAHPEARAMAGAAAEVPGLDELALMALADWLEERQFPTLAAGAKVRRLAVRDGDLLAIECEGVLTPEARKNLRQSMERLFAERGRDVVVVVLEEGLKLSHFRTGKRD